MRRRPRWSRIFAACAVLTVLVGVVSMFFVVFVGHVGIGWGLLYGCTDNRWASAHVGWIRGDVLITWNVRLRTALVPYLSRYCVGIPLWMPAVAFAALAWFTRSRGKQPGCCGECGYNLTGNVSGRCPECGTISKLHAAGTSQDVQS